MPYDYGALEPIISAEIMQIHHQKHHATYVNNLNQIEEKFQEAIASSKFFLIIFKNKTFYPINIKSFNILIIKFM